MSQIEDLLALQIRAAGLPEPVREFRFAPPRRWRLDFAYPSIGLGIECEGGTFASGRHSRGLGMRADMQKYNELALMGWTLVRFDRELIECGAALECLRRALQKEKRE